MLPEALHRTALRPRRFVPRGARSPGLRRWPPRPRWAAPWGSRTASGPRPLRQATTTDLGRCSLSKITTMILGDVWDMAFTHVGKSPMEYLWKRMS